jgi:hypothetical protein
VTPASCATLVIETGDCLHDSADDYCVGWCYASDALGCSSAECLDDCHAKADDTTCGTQWTSMLDCALFFGDAACTDGELMGNGICDSEVSDYQTCIMGQGT